MGNGRCVCADMCRAVNGVCIPPASIPEFEPICAKPAKTLTCCECCRPNVACNVGQKKDWCEGGTKCRYESVSYGGMPRRTERKCYRQSLKCGAKERANPQAYFPHCYRTQAVALIDGEENDQSAYPLSSALVAGVFTCALFVSLATWLHRRTSASFTEPLLLA